MDEQLPEEREGDVPLYAGWACAVASGFFSFTWAREFVQGETTFLEALPPFTPLVTAVFLAVAAAFLGFFAISRRRLNAGLFLIFGAIVLPIFGIVWVIATPVVTELQG